MTKENILIVENQRILSEDLDLTLRDFGYSICGRASSGKEAVEMVTRVCVGLVLMDIKLEGPMDGIEAAEKIKSIIKTPIVYLTAYSDTALLERVKRTAPHGFLLKPYKTGELRAVIEIALWKFSMEEQLRRKTRAMQQAIESSGCLRGLLSICAHCKKIRTEDGGWELLENFIEARSAAKFSHGICPQCAREYFPDLDIYNDDGTL